MYVDVVVVSWMSDVDGWYRCIEKEVARWSMLVAGIVEVGREAARWLMTVAGLVEVGRSMSKFLKYIGLTGGGGCWCSR